MSHVEGLSQITANLNKAMGREIAKMNKRVEMAGDVVHSTIKQRASLTDHPQWLLTALGSPYSTRYSTDYFPGGGHKDDSLVHIQSGTLYRNIEKVTDIGENKAQVAVGVRKGNVPHIDELMNGAPKVRPRPFIQRGFSESKEAVKTILGGGLGG
jgi:hypothetical protein